MIVLMVRDFAKPAVIDGAFGATSLSLSLSLSHPCSLSPPLSLPLSLSLCPALPLCTHRWHISYNALPSNLNASRVRPEARCCTPTYNAYKRKQRVCRITRPRLPERTKQHCPLNEKQATAMRCHVVA